MNKFKENKIPKRILSPNTYPINKEKVNYTEYKFHHKEYEGCYCYIHWWQNGDGKWKPFKIYLEKGNRLYNDYMTFLKKGTNDESGWSYKFYYD